MGGLRIAIDSSVLIGFLQGQAEWDMSRLEQALRMDNAVLPPVVLSETLSYPCLEEIHRSRILNLTVLDILEGFWERAGRMRAGLIARTFKPKLPDTLIAQSCIDHQIPLLTRDEGFRIFEDQGLSLLKQH